MRQCNCSGQCGPQPEGLSRREFLELTAAGAAGALLAGPALGATFELPAEEFEKWKRDLLGPSRPRVYSSDKHTDARMHLGGIGTGNFEVGADGQFTTWQLFNTLRDGQVPFYLAIKAGAVARLLQTAGGPDWPRVPRIEMTGEYPVATLRFLDGALPVQVELSAFSPFAPLDTALSSVPLAALVFRLRNTSGQAQTVSLAAFMQNPVGYDARGANDWAAFRHPGFGGNVTEPLQAGRAHGLVFRAVPAGEPSLDKPVHLFASNNLAGLNSPPPARPDKLKLEMLDRLPAALAELKAPEQTVVWIEEAAADFPEALLRAVRNAVRAGATLILSGRTQPLLRAYAAVTGGKPLSSAAARPDIVFEDFERGYENWTVEGTAFGTKPATGTLPFQQHVSGFLGQGLVNSYLGGDDSTGKLTSKPFTIERHFIRFLVGGGQHRTTQVRLLVGGKVVRATSGKDNERLEPATWDVREFEGKPAHLEIVDAQQGPWGHINVDHIVFSDQPANPEAMALLEELLPARFSGLQELPAQPDGLRRVRFEGLELLPNATRKAVREPRPLTPALSPGGGEGARRAGEGTPAPAAAPTGNSRTEPASETGLEAFSRPVGSGKVVLVAGQILDPAQAEFSAACQRAYALVCELAGAKYDAGVGQHPKAPGFGTVALAVLAGETTALPAFDDWARAWQQFATDGRFTELEKLQPTAPTPPGRTTAGAVATTLILSPGETVEVPFLLTWHYPNKYNAAGIWMGCHYATRWPDARAVMQDAAANFESWRARTELFRKTFYDSTLPWWLLDCLTANAAIIRHIGVVFRIANGDCYGWEGSNGCCQPTCTHVWGYEQTLARLFPELEREMRRIDFKHQQRPDGGVNNRTEVPSPPRPTGEHPFADGHASCILKAYREALNSADDSFFKQYWPHIRRAVEYLIERDAKSHGGQPAGYLEDDQWNTYDQALHGVTTFISGYYLAALRAGEEWARRMGDTTTADRFHAIFEKGQQKLVELCWEGEYFRQHLPGYEKMRGEVGPGCMSDQLIGQWWAHQLGLGYILPRDKVVSALKSIFKYNFKTDLTGWKHAPRAFAGAKDKGLIICTWPKGGRPGHVMLYSDEVWTGIEYQVAAHMVYEGLVEEGLAIVKAARDRYDGVPRPPIGRNPWNEIECGGHYARAMSSWSLLLALSGWFYDGPRRLLRLQPRYRPEDFRCFWSGPEGWGNISQKIQAGRQTTDIMVRSGRLRVKRLELAVAAGLAPARVATSVAGRLVGARTTPRAGWIEIVFEPEIEVLEGQAMTVAAA